jgi:hypothetical protein
MFRPFGHHHLFFSAWVNVNIFNYIDLSKEVTQDITLIYSNEKIILPQNMKKGSI